MKHAYQISREDSSEAPDKTTTAERSGEIGDLVRLFADECLSRVTSGNAQKAVITIERIVTDD